MLTPEIASDIVAQCQAAAGEIGQAFTRALGIPIEAAVPEPTSRRLLDAHEELESPGLAITLHFGLSALAILVPKQGGLLPRDYDAADPKSQSALTTLAQELGMLVLPESLLAEDVAGCWVAELAGALREGGASESASLVSLVLKSGDQRANAFIVWPLTSARQITKVREARGGAGSPAQHAQAGAADASSAPTQAGEAAALAAGSWPGETLGDIDSAGGIAALAEAPNDAVRTGAKDDVYQEAAAGAKKYASARGPSLRDLPSYSRSLLKIRVPLSVTLADKKQPLGQILEIGPGSILQFEKSCEDMLDLNVSNLAIARGEAVKVGDKFGLRVTSLILPSERFKAVQPGLHQSASTTS